MIDCVAHPKTMPPPPPTLQQQGMAPDARTGHHQGADAGVNGLPFDSTVVDTSRVAVWGTVSRAAPGHHTAPRRRARRRAPRATPPPSGHARPAA